MQTQPLVSFVIYIRNTRPEMLRNSIKSVIALSLSRQEREIVVVDDGSDVCLLDDITEFVNDIIYIRQSQRGLPEARNIGLRIAHGRYIQFLSGEETLISAPYEHCLDLVRYHNPDIVLFKTTATDKAIDIPFTYDGPMTGSEYMRSNNIKPDENGYIFERTTLGNLHFTQEMRNAEGTFIPLLLLRSERFFYTDAKACLKSGDKKKEDTCENQHRSFEDTERALLRLRLLVVPETDRPALNRQIALLTMNYLRGIIKRTHSRRQLEDAMTRLSDNGLYPLPAHNYSKEYTLFRKMIANSLMRRLLILTTK